MQPQLFTVLYVLELAHFHQPMTFRAETHRSERDIHWCLTRVSGARYLGARLRDANRCFSSDAFSACDDYVQCKENLLRAFGRFRCARPTA